LLMMVQNRRKPNLRKLELKANLRGGKTGPPDRF